MILFYNLFRKLYLAAAHLLALSNVKAKKWVDGRKDVLESLKTWRSKHLNEEVLWMHCASTGEYEQGRPVAEAIKKLYPEVKLVISFFSPSGYEAAVKHTVADLYLYLPFDGPTNASKFIALLQPRLVLFVKYEYWYYYLKTLKQQQIPTLLISAIFRSNQPFFQWWGSFHRSMLHCFTHVFTQDENSQQLLLSVVPETNASMSGDTRFDRVMSIAAQWKALPLIDAFCSDKKILIAGSTWPEDEVLLKEWHTLQANDWKLIIVPHVIDMPHLKTLQEKFTEAAFYSRTEQNTDLSKSSVLIIDTIGMLSKLYKYATVCYLGGGFNRSGIHNILEAAVYGKPIFSGPEHSKYREAIALKQAGAYVPVKDGKELSNAIYSTDIVAAGSIASHYVQRNSGATAVIGDWIQENRLLTKA